MILDSIEIRGQLVCSIHASFQLLPASSVPKSDLPFRTKMVLLRNVVKVAACVSGCALASKLVDDGTLRKAHALTTAERRTFEEHFPRGSWDDNWDL